MYDELLKQELGVNYLKLAWGTEKFCRGNKKTIGNI
jgi:hypothetical protein